MKTNPELMELQQRIWAYEWLERALLSLSWVNRYIFDALGEVELTAYYLYQAAHRLWWAFKFKRMRKE
jgi:hypothetical protein